MSEVERFHILKHFDIRTERSGACDNKLKVAWQSELFAFSIYLIIYRAQDFF